MKEIPIEIPKFKTRIVGLQKKRIYLIPKKRRIEELEKAHYNLFLFDSSDNFSVDLQTASGTCAPSQKQHRMSSLYADPSYTASKSAYRLRESIRNFTGKDQIFFVNQGRAAEDAISEHCIEEGDYVVSNGLFDTTDANMKHAGAECINIPASSQKSSFRGNIDIASLEKIMRVKKVKMVVMTLTNNTEGGQPVSLANLTCAAQIARENGSLFVIDACRIAQNAYFIWRDQMQGRMEIPDIIRKCFSFADIAYMSLKKDGLAHGGGFVVFDAKNVTAMPQKDFNEKMDGVHNHIIRTTGNAFGYAGCAEVMEQAAQGLIEVVDLRFLEKRMGDTAYLQEQLKKAGAPIMNNNPPGGDAVYIDAGKALPGISYPAKTLEIAFYKEGGIRTCGIDSTMFPDSAHGEILRLAIPARIYGKKHFDYVADIYRKIMDKKNELKGFKMTYDPGTLRHFKAHFAPL